MSHSAERADLPRRCGRYILVERLGEGGMAEVYKARLAQTEGPERVLVIKLLPPGADPAAAARFIDEANIALPLTHGNITATFEFGRDVDRPFLVMEYVHGRSLRQVIDALADRGETISLPTGLYIGREVARALRYAHNFIDVDGEPRPVIHRDVSPENVLISFAGQVKLTDFGIARSMGALDLGGAWGKPPYVAPEILEGDPGGPPADIYSLGCVVYEMLSGWPPLIGKTEEETLRLVRTQAPVPLRQLRDELPDTLDDLLVAMLEKSPSRRCDVGRLEVTLSQLISSTAPHFTDADLAAALSRLFKSQRTSGESKEVLLAERLRGQLESAGVATSGRESAAEMLALGTVQLSPAPQDLFGEGDFIAPSTGERADTTLKVSPPHQLKRLTPRRASAVIGLALAVIIAVGLLAASFFGWRPLGGAAGSDAEGALAGLTNSAARSATPDSGAAPPTGAPDAAAAVTIVAALVGADGDSTASDAAPSDLRHADADRQDNNRVRRQRPATVTFNSHPWSFVYVGGRKLPGHTPIRNVSMPPGRYRVRFINPELNLSASKSIVLRPGESSFVKVRLGPVRGGSE